MWRMKKSDTAVDCPPATAAMELHDNTDSFWAVGCPAGRSLFLLLKRIQEEDAGRRHWIRMY